MGVSIYYEAKRDRAISPAEQAAIDWAISLFPIESLIRKCGSDEIEFDGESFHLYSPEEIEDGRVIFEGATGIPLYTYDASITAIKYWCRLLTEVRRVLYDAEWIVDVDGGGIHWNDKEQEYTP